jgi:hypothetical protein
LVEKQHFRAEDRRHLADAQRAVETAARTAVDLESTLREALMIASTCAREYLAPDVRPAIRRMFNQGLFVALYIDPDGRVERFELTEPFATLLDGTCWLILPRSGWLDERLRPVPKR